MKNKNRNLFFGKWTIGLCITGLLINIILSNIVLLLGLPLYLDNVGSILVGALGGTLPGIIVGFLSNVINTLDTPISLYYGFLTVAMAWLASVYSKKGLFKKWWGGLTAAISYVAIGGAVGSLMTWMIFGGQISGIAAPIAFRFEAAGMSTFLSQLTADVLLDIPDKFLTVAIAYLCLHFYPKKLYGKFAYSYIYEKNSIEKTEPQKLHKKYRHSITSRISNFTVIIIAVVGTFALVIGALYYDDMLSTNSKSSAQYISSRAAQCINGDTVTKLFEDKIETEEYLETEQNLVDVYYENPDIRYVYVYIVKESGCYVLYDVDTDTEKGAELGAYVENDPDIYERLDEFLKGGAVSSGSGNSTFGTLVSAYTPVYNSAGDTVAYACADIDQLAYMQKFAIYIIQFASLLFAIVLIALIMMRRYVDKHINNPIDETIRLTRALEKISPDEWITSEVWQQKQPVRTDDELEELYQTVTDAEESVSVSVRKRIETEQKLLQTKELERINSQLEAAIEKADKANLAKSDFLSRMSHDMRTPMNGILGITALLRDRTDPAEIRADIDQIEMSAKYLLSLINDTLDMSKIESGKMILHPEPIVGKDMFTNIIATANILAAQKGVHFVTDFPSDDNDIWVPVLADASRVEQVFINLISNAIKFTNSGGTVTLKMEMVSRTDKTLCDRFIVSDNGIGMSEEFQKHLFEPFAQEGRANNSGESGTGLGLSIVKQIVDLMGGKISLESKINEGTTFTVELSYSRYDGEMKINSDAPVDLNILNGKRILLCEDHPINAQIAIRLLNKQGMIVERAENGQLGVEMFKKSAENYYAAILMDIRMPVLDGIGAASEIRKMDIKYAQTIPIIAMTANAFEDDKQQTKAAGMNDHLAKPIEPDKLYTTLARKISQQ